MDLHSALLRGHLDCIAETAASLQSLAANFNLTMVSSTYGLLTSSAP